MNNTDIAISIINEIDGIIGPSDSDHPIPLHEPDFEVLTLGSMLRSALIRVGLVAPVNGSTNSSKSYHGLLELIM